MEKPRDSYIFYRSFYEAIHELKDDIKLEVFTAITEYALYGKLPEDLKPVTKGMFALIKPNLDTNNARYENGKKGGRKPRKAPDPLIQPPAPNESPSPGVTPAEIPAIEDEIARIKEDRKWTEAVSMQFRIDPDELDARLEAFATHCKVERDSEPHPSLKDAKRHFTSWMRKAYAITDGKSNDHPKPDDYTYKGGFGSKDQ